MKRLMFGVEAIISTSLICTMTMVPVQADEGESFDDFMESEFVDIMESDYMTCHFTLKDYEQYGITKPELTIGSAKWSDYEDAVNDSQTSLDTLHTFDYDKLDDTQKTDYKVYENALENSIAVNSYPYLDFWFDSADGMIGNIDTNFTEFIFYTEEDFDDYLTVLSTVDDYFSDALDITKKQAEAGYFLTNDMLSDTDDLIDKFVAKTDNNELIRIFEERVDAFEGLSDAKKEELKAKNKDIVLNEVIPAYQNAEDVLDSLKGSRVGDYSVSSMQDGAEWYAARAKYKTSLDTDVQGMLDICTEYLQTAIEEFYSLNENITQDEYDETIDLNTPEEVLQYLQNHMENFPEGPEVNYTAEYLDSSVANSSTVAYYMEPPIDDLTDNVIKINGDNIDDTNDMYITLAHEGFPGHLYQITYYLNTNPSKIRTVVSNMGYTEGWGMYAEMQAMDQAPMSENARTYYALNDAISYVMDAAADLGVNGLGWSTKELASYLEGLALNSDIASSLYSFVTEEPCIILPYGVGLAKYELLEQKAKETKGDSFNMLEFNTVLLKNGDRPFVMVEEDINTWLGTASQTSEPLVTESPEADETTQTNWIVYGSIGGGIAAVGIVALILARKNRKDNPFRS